MDFLDLGVPFALSNVNVDPFVSLSSLIFRMVFSISSTFTGFDGDMSFVSRVISGVGSTSGVGVADGDVVSGSSLEITTEL